MLSITSVWGQVLGGSSTYGTNSGLGIYFGTISMTGRSFGYLDEQTYNRMSVEPDSYQRRLINPLFGIGWWSEIPSDDFVFGYQALGYYGAESYQVSFGSEAVTGSGKAIGLALSAYIGWHFGDQLTALVGVQEENRLPISEEGRVNIFSSHSSVGIMGMLRYSFVEDYFVALQAGYGLFSFGGGFDSDWEKYKQIGTEGYYVVDSDTKPFILMLGIGRGF